MSSERKTLEEMAGEFCREAAVLVAVFGILEKFLRGEQPSIEWTAKVLLASLYAFGTGVILERWRR